MSYPESAFYPEPSDFRGPVPIPDAEDLEPMDRATCHACIGRGELNGRRCTTCNGMGVEQTRNELADGDRYIESDE